MELNEILVEEEKLYDCYVHLYEETGNCIFRDIAKEKQTHIKYLKEMEPEE